MNRYELPNGEPLERMLFFDPTLTFSKGADGLTTRFEAVGREIDAFASAVPSLTVSAQLRRDSDEPDSGYTISSDIQFKPLQYWSKPGNRVGFLQQGYRTIPEVWSTVSEMAESHDLLWLRSGPHPATITAFLACRGADGMTVYFIGSDFKRNTEHRTQKYSLPRRVPEQLFAAGIDVAVDSIVQRADCTLVHPGYLERRYSHAKRIETTLISTVRNDEIETNAEWNPNESAKILYVGRLTKEKGIDILIESFRELAETIEPTPELMIRGTGGDEEALREQIQSYELSSQVTFVTFLPFEELLQLYRDADIFVLPSRIEGQGRVLIEALASGCVVIGTDVGGIPAIVSHEENGLLIEAGMNARLTEAMERVLSDTDLAEKLVTNGVQWAHDHTVQKETNRAIENVLQTNEE